MDTFEEHSQFAIRVHTIAVRIAITELRRAKWRDISLDEMNGLGLDLSPCPGKLRSKLPGPPLIYGVSQAIALIKLAG